ALDQRIAVVGEHPDLHPGFLGVLIQDGLDQLFDARRVDRDGLGSRMNHCGRCRENGQERCCERSDGWHVESSGAGDRMMRWLPVRLFPARSDIVKEMRTIIADFPRRNPICSLSPVSPEKVVAAKTYS